MANLTISVDDDTLRLARIRALHRNESVNSYLADMLRRYAGDATPDAVQGLLDVSRKHPAGEPGRPRTWTRDDLHRV